MLGARLTSPFSVPLPPSPSHPCLFDLGPAAEDVGLEAARSKAQKGRGGASGPGGAQARGSAAGRAGQEAEPTAQPE